MLKRPGYVRQDNRASGGGLFEADVKTCAHCMAQIMMNPERQRPRNYCRKCDKYICDNPACHFECSPYVRRLDEKHELALRGLNVKEI